MNWFEIGGGLVIFALLMRCAWLENRLEAALGFRDALDYENERLRRQVAGHCERIAAQSEILARRAERQ